MKRGRAILFLSAAGCVVLALLAVFALELANTQAQSKRAVRGNVHARAVLAGALIESLFEAVEQQVPLEARSFGALVVSPRVMNRARHGDAYVVLLDAASGRVIAHSAGFTSQAAANLAGSPALTLVRSGHSYGLGNVRPYGRAGVINFAVLLPTRSGRRILVFGFAPGVLGSLVTGELEKIPGVAGAHNYLIDGANTVLASTNPKIRVGHHFDSPAQVRVLSRPSGVSHGRYYNQVKLSNSTWRILLTAPTGPLFASVSGVRRWVPWLIFIALALVVLIALALSRRVLRKGDELRDAHDRLALVNDELATTNVKLTRRAAELARSNSELDQFASIASHDLQEPLRKVRTFTQRLTVMESDRLSDKGQDYLRRADAAAERMQALIQDLLSFSRVATAGRAFTRVDLTQVCRQILDDLDHEVESARASVLVGDLPVLQADPLQMRQLFQNLISNALKFRRAGIPPEISIDSSVSDGVAEITVRDNGIGFDPQYSLRIFRIFERLHPRSEYPGTGIGLALCRKIAERHGGTVTAVSSPGVGSAFTVTLETDRRGEAIVADPPGPRQDVQETYVRA